MVAAPITLIIPRDAQAIRDLNLGEVAGFLLLREYAKPGTHLSLGAEYEIIYLYGEILNRKISKQDRDLLEELGWSYGECDAVAGKVWYTLA